MKKEVSNILLTWKGSQQYFANLKKQSAKFCLLSKKEVSNI
jgi:hypothetical protein